jgi:hypothetical protein
MPLPVGNVIRFGHESLQRFSFSDSDSNSWIQAADLLASSLNRCLVQLNSGEVLSETLADLAKSTLPALYISGEDGPEIARWICSPSMKQKVVDVLKRKSVDPINRGRF